MRRSIRPKLAVIVGGLFLTSCSAYETAAGELGSWRFDLTDAEWEIVAPLLPNKPRGVPREDDRRVLNGIFYVLRTGSPWRDLPERYGPYTTCYNRFNP
jgi:hypothetical protein